MNHAIQKMRLQRGWSQQQLADAAGLSARTIQRIEAGAGASTETLKSIAAVFEVDFSTLEPEPSMQATTADPRHREEAEAFAHVRRLRGFYAHAAKYVLVISILVVVNLVTRPQHLWVLWVIGGWGIGLASHALAVFRPMRWFGPEWERAQVEKRLGRPL
ncbi:MAG: hypothetical protein RLZZ524_860 [Pseudomonadota bacterium]|jgi:transcriptional regulator with XRE-family HTH domain